MTNDTFVEEEYLMLSGIQHFAFCPRQWGLIHLEHQWEENILTTQGKILHERVDNPFEKESRGSKIITRAMQLISHKLKLSGQADSVEFHLQEKNVVNGIKLKDKEGLWQVFPVEYKRGRPKKDDCDKVQLCAQAVCLEEMFEIQIPEGAIFYGAIKRRNKILFTKDLRSKVATISKQMLQSYNKKITPTAIKGKHCKSCSLINICLPSLNKKLTKIEKYLDQAMED